MTARESRLGRGHLLDECSPQSEGLGAIHAEAMLVAQKVLVAGDALLPRDPQVVLIGPPIHRASEHDAVDHLERPAVLVQDRAVVAGGGIREVAPCQPFRPPGHGEGARARSVERVDTQVVRLDGGASDLLGQQPMHSTVDEETRGQERPVASASSACDEKR